MNKIVSLILIYAVLGSTFFYVGQVPKGGVSGRVTDADGNGLPGATVTIVSDKTLTRRTVITDDNGQFRAVQLDPADNYTVTVSLDGFSTSKRDNVKVNGGKTTTLDDTKLSLAEITEELIVTAEAPLVDVTRGNSKDVTLQLTESLPTARSYQDYLQLVPGIQDALGSTDNPASRSGIGFTDGIYERVNSPGITSFLVDVTIPNNQTADSIQFRANWKADFSLDFGPEDWTARQAGKRIYAEGPPVSRVRLSFNTTFSGDDLLFDQLGDRKIQVVAKNDGRTVLRDNYSLAKWPGFDPTRNIGDVLDYPYQIRADEWFLASVPKNLYDHGDWRLIGTGGFENPPSGQFSEPFRFGRSEYTNYLVAPPADFGEGGALSFYYIDRWNKELLKGPANDLNIAPPANGSCSPSLGGSAPRVFAGNKLCTCGCYSDPKTWYSLDLDGKPVSPAAASSTVIHVRIPNDTAPGLHTISWRQGAGYPAQSIQFRVVAVKGTIDQNKLWTGESTKMRLQVLGTTESLPLEITNKTPNVISLEGGNKQTVNSSGGANNIIERNVKGIRRGNFEITFKLDESPCPCLNPE